mgnify:CR=1 FL=1
MITAKRNRRQQQQKQARADAIAKSRANAAANKIQGFRRLITAKRKHREDRRKANAANKIGRFLTAKQKSRQEDARKASAANKIKRMMIARRNRRQRQQKSDRANTIANFRASRSASRSASKPLLLGYDDKLKCPPGKVYEMMNNEKRCLIPCKKGLSRNPRTKRCVKSIQKARLCANKTAMRKNTKTCKSGYENYKNKCC